MPILLKLRQSASHLNHANRVEGSGNGIEAQLAGIALLGLLDNLELSDDDRTQESVNDGVVEVAAGIQLLNHVYTPRRGETRHLSQSREPAAAGWLIRWRKGLLGGPYGLDQGWDI
jgi:hypothetical protein